MDENKELQGTAVAIPDKALLALAKVTEMRNTALALKDTAKALKIESQEDLDLADSCGSQVAKAEKDVKDLFEPSRVATKAKYDGVLADKNKCLKPVLEAKTLLKQKMGVYKRAQKAKREEVQKTLPAGIEIPVQKSQVGTQDRENWQWKADGSVIPPPWMCWDEKEITAWVKNQKAKTKIDGIEVYDAGTIAFRG